MTPPPAGAGRTRLLDALRGLLASWVLLHHMVVYTGFDLNALPWRLLVRHGQEPVAVFFVLSGFAIARSLFARPQPLPSFLLARVWRIYPVYVIALALGVATWWLAPPLARMPWRDPAGPHLEHWSARQVGPLWLHLLLHLTQLHGLLPGAFLPGADTTLVPTAWSLSTEFQFYLLAPALCWLVLPRRGVPRLASWAILAVALVLPDLLRSPLISFANLAGYLDLFVLGILGAITHDGRWRARLVHVLAALVVLAGALAGGRVVVANGVVVWLGFWGLSLLPAAERWLDHPAGRLALWAGAISYPLYIVQMPVLRLSLVATLGVLHPGHGLFLAVWLPVTFGLCFGLAAVLHRYVEVPGTRHGKRLARVPQGRGARPCLAHPGDGPASGVAWRMPFGLAGTARTLPVLPPRDLRPGAGAAETQSDLG